MKDRRWEDNLGHLDNIMTGVGGGEIHCGCDVALKEVPREAVKFPSLETFKI